ncbi:conserved hypothetical protein [Gammaproteobacteria bacterium]
MEKFDLQDEQYSFPYHYLVSFQNNTLSISKSLPWGYEYLTYVGAIKKEIEKITPKSLLDVGCGDGYLINHLEMVDCKTLGVDLSQKAIKFAKAFGKEESFLCDSINKVDLEFDVVTLVEVLEHIPDSEIDQFLQEVTKRVSIGGFLLISVPSTVLKLQKKHYRHYTEVVLEEQISKSSGLHKLRSYRVVSNSRFKSLLVKLIDNKFWTIKVPWILKLFYSVINYIDKRVTNENGRHIIAVYTNSLGLEY